MGDRRREEFFCGFLPVSYIRGAPMRGNKLQLDKSGNLVQPCKLRAS